MKRARVPDRVIELHGWRGERIFAVIRNGRLKAAPQHTSGERDLADVYADPELMQKIVRGGSVP